MPESDPSSDSSPSLPEPHLRIRHAVPADRDVIQRLCLAGEEEFAFVLEPGEPYPEDFHEHAESGDPVGGFWVAETTGANGADDPRVVGMLALRSLEGHVAEARRLFVEPDFRGQGIGMRLLEQLVGRCRDAGYLKVVLDVGEKSETALRLFNRLGFQLAREREADGRTIMDFYLDIYRDGPG